MGDLISNGTIRNTIEDGKCKGFGIVKEIMAILDDVPLGGYKMAVGNPYLSRCFCRPVSLSRV